MAVLISKIDCVSSAAEGDFVRISVSVENSGVAQYVKIVGLATGTFNTFALDFDGYKLINTSGADVFVCSFVMPAGNVDIGLIADVYSYDDNDWHFSDGAQYTISSGIGISIVTEAFWQTDTFTPIQINIHGSAPVGSRIHLVLELNAVQKILPSVFVDGYVLPALRRNGIAPDPVNYGTAFPDHVDIYGTVTGVSEYGNMTAGFSAKDLVSVLLVAMICAAVICVARAYVESEKIQGYTKVQLSADSLKLPQMVKDAGGTPDQILKAGQVAAQTAQKLNEATGTVAQISDLVKNLAIAAIVVGVVYAAVKLLPAAQSEISYRQSNRKLAAGSAK